MLSTTKFGYEPIRAFIRERLKSVRNPEAIAELQSIITLCDALEHQEHLLDTAFNASFDRQGGE